MKFQGIIPVLLVLAIICISTSSARKAGRDKKPSTTSTETSVESRDKDHEGLSAELLVLKDHARNVTNETSTRRPKEKKQKHRRKNKHHRGPHRQKMRNRTRPTDILRAEDDKFPNPPMFPNSDVENVGSNEKLPVPKSQRKGKKNGRNRGTRHLDMKSGDSPRKFTNGHHGGHQEESEIANKHHKRRRNHHKKHKTPFTPSLDFQGRHVNKHGKSAGAEPSMLQLVSSVTL